MLHIGQKLGGIMEKYWLDEMSPKLVERGFTGLRKFC
jgi:hypothetical protein